MKILILNWRDPKNPKSGGAEIVTLEHAKEWSKQGHTVTWLASRFTGAQKNEVIDTVRIIRLGGSLSVYLLAPFYYLFSGKTYDVVIDEIHGIPFFTPLYVRKPKIAFIHEVAGEIWDSMFPFPVNKIGKLAEQFYFSLYKKTLFWTDAPSTIQDLEEHGINKVNCTAIACPITNKSLDTFPKKEKELTCLFVSRLVKMKGIEDVIKSFILIQKEKQDAKLWIVGRGEKSYVNALKDFVSKNNISKNVTFFVNKNDKEKLSLMQRAHVLLHASKKEGWGLVVLEAASQMTPAVVYNVAGLRDSVIHNKTGLIVGSNNPEELSKETIKLFKDHDLYKKFQKNGVAWVTSLTWENAAKQSMKLIDQAIAKQKKQ